MKKIRSILVFQDIRNSFLNSVSVKVYGPSLRSALQTPFTYPDARRGPNDPSNEIITRLATDLAFDFTTRKWKNVNKEYAHEELKFISSMVPEGNDCQLNLDDVIVFLRDWLNKEKLSMQLLSSDESRDPPIISYQSLTERFNLKMAARLGQWIPWREFWLHKQGYKIYSHIL